MRIFLDTNILVDLCLDRQPHALCAQRLIESIEAGHAKAHIAAISLTNLYYLLHDLNKKRDVRKDIGMLLDLLTVVATDEELLRRALGNGFKDFEDGIQYESALACQAVVLVTRNRKDFRASKIELLDACELMVRLGQ